MTISDVTQGLTYFLAMLFALTFHEAAHAFASNFLGDDLARREGRLSLNPAVHVDPIGTLFFPLVCSVVGAPFIGWAKPVPYDERNFKKPVRDAMLTAAAGPVSNIILGFICALILALNYQYQWSVFQAGSPLAPAIKIIAAMTYVNGMLAFLNLIPLPPLDGATIMRAFVNRDFWDRYEETIGPYGFIIFLMLAFAGLLNWIGSFTVVYVKFITMLAESVVG